MPHDFIALDFETANSNFNSACSLGLVAVKDMEIVETKYFLIQPPTLYFHYRNIEIHGITPDDVKNSPKFDHIWKEIRHYFHNNIIVAHNAIFDMSVLKNCLHEYHLDCPNSQYLCSIDLSEYICDKSVGRSLVNRLDHFNIRLEKHHNALNDAIACAKITIECIKNINKKPFKSYFLTYNTLPLKLISDIKIQTTSNKTPKKNFDRIAISEISASNDCYDKSHIFYGKNIIFTGELSKMTRKDAMQKVVDFGAIFKNGISSKVDFIIVGIQDISVVGEKGISEKEKKAIQLKEQGHHIRIIKEDEFLKILE